jgi:dipeptidyl aminopeptidase/acylaminoacyl peptidase
MRWSTLALLAVALPVCAAVPGPERPLTDPHALHSPSVPGAGPVPIADLFYSRGSAGAAWSPNGRQVVLSTNFTGRYNLWKVDAAGGWPVQLTQSEERQFGAAWSPDGRAIVFQSDRGGDEMFQLYMVPAEGGEVVALTSEPQVSHTEALFSPDGRQLAFDRKPKGAPVNDVTVLDLRTHAQRQLTHEASHDHVWQVFAWSRDGRSLYANRGNAAFTDSSVWRIDAATGRTTELTPHKGQALVVGSAVSPDGRWLNATSDARDGHSQAVLIDTSTHALRWVTDGPWEASTAGFSPDGRQAAYMVNADGRSDLFLYDLRSGNSRKLTLAPGLNVFAGNPSPFSPDGSRLLVNHQSSSQPSDLWTVPVDGTAARQLSHGALASLAAAQLPEAQLVHYRSFDGTVISAFVWLPPNLKRDGTAPAVVLPHGGPTGQTVDAFYREALALASRGYVCIAPNVRGSSGYGIDFQKSNIRDLGGGDLKDEVAAVDFLLASGYVDAKKVGISGGSYGGYMTLMALGRTPKVWAAGVDSYGIINWLTMAQHSDPFLQQYLRALLGDPKKDRAIYEAASPLTYLKHARAPLLVLQGDNDIRVPKEEAEQVVTLLKGIGQTVDVHYYPQEGHGFSRRENQIDALERTVAWFDRYLKGSVPAAAPPGG